MTAAPRLRAVLAAPEGAIKLWHTSVGPDQAPVAVWAGPDESILFTAHDDRGRIVRTTRSASAGLRSLDHLQPLPGGRWVMVDARADWSTIDGVTRNAVLVAPDGEHLSRECVGDAVDQLLASPSGALWAGYWDEATTGETQAQLIGSSGLVGWSDRLRRTWTYDGSATGSWILTCDALTLDGERVVAAVDVARQADDGDDARVLVVDDGVATDHRGGVAEAWGVLAAADDIALLGGADDDTLVTVARLEDGQVRVLGTLRIDVNPDALTARVCRGDTLHLFEGDRWSTVALAELVAAADA